MTELKKVVPRLKKKKGYGSMIKMQIPKPYLLQDSDSVGLEMGPGLLHFRQSHEVILMQEDGESWFESLM